MKSVGIIGAAGYVGGELLRLLLYHPEVELAFIQSDSQAGRPVAEVHDDLAGLCDKVFTNQINWEVDVLFLCMAHGKSASFVAANAGNLKADTLLIDMSQDFRLDPGFVYGLPEVNETAIAGSRRIANPGCFATAIQLALLPLAQAGMLGSEIHVNATTGSTGAGQALQETTHFSRRHANLSVYKPFTHQHLAEIGHTLHQLQPGLTAPLRFIPMRGAFARGILAVVYTHAQATEAELQALYQHYYAKAPFTSITAQEVQLKQVVNTNRCLLQVQKHDDQVLIVSAIDNLLKGASGQAVQNMNLAMGWPQQTGLLLKSVVF